MKSKNVFWGIFLICSAILVIVNQLGYFSSIGLWSLLITLAMVPIMFYSAIHINFFGILMPVAVLAIVYAEPLGITAIVPWPVLIAAVLASIGLSIIFKRNYWGRWKERHVHFERKWEDDVDHINGENTDTFNENVVTAEVNFGGSIKYIHSQNLQRAHLECNFASLKVYFDQARLCDQGAEVNVSCSFGSVILYIPRSWNVVDRLSASLGGVKNYKGGGTAEDAPVLTLDGDVSLGYLEVVYV